MFHDPKSAEKLENARRAGGQKNRPTALPRTSADISLNDSNDVRCLLRDTISQVRRAEIDCRVANSIGYLAGLASKVMERCELEKRLDVLEEAVKVNQRPSGYDFEEILEETTGK